MPRTIPNPWRKVSIMDPQKLAELAAAYHVAVNAHMAAQRKAQDLETQSVLAWDEVNTASETARKALQALASYAEAGAS